MNVHDYLIEHDAWPWNDLLRHWTWLLPETFSVWLVNRFGDLFIRLDDGSIHHLDIGSGTLRQVAKNREEFCDGMSDTDANHYFMIPLVDQLVAAGQTLGPAECYSYRLAPAFGGSYTLDNFIIRPVAKHYAIFGPLHEVTQDVPDGGRVRFKTGTADCEVSTNSR